MRIARDVVFGEGWGWAWDKAVDDGSTSTNNDFVVEYAHFEEAELSVTKHVYPSSGSPPAPASPSSMPPAMHAYASVPYVYTGAPYTYADIHSSKLSTASSSPR